MPRPIGVHKYSPMMLVSIANKGTYRDDLGSLSAVKREPLMGRPRMQVGKPAQ